MLWDRSCQRIAESMNVNFMFQNHPTCGLTVSPGQGEGLAAWMSLTVYRLGRLGAGCVLGGITSGLMCLMWRRCSSVGPLAHWAGHKRGSHSWLGRRGKGQTMIRLGDAGKVQSCERTSSGVQVPHIRLAMSSHIMLCWQLQTTMFGSSDVCSALHEKIQHGPAT